MLDFQIDILEIINFKVICVVFLYSVLYILNELQDFFYGNWICHWKSFNLYNNIVSAEMWNTEEERII